MALVGLWLVLLCASCCSAVPVPDSLLVLVKSPDSVQMGHTATFQCWLSPLQSAEDLEVRWYRGNEHFDSPVLHYKGKKLVTESQDASYIDRVSFTKKDATSGGLVAGDVSLKLVNVTIQDAGGYTCYVSSDRVYDSAMLHLFVTETGSSPLLSLMWKEDNMVNVTCESEGWYPQPVLRWSDQETDPIPEVLEYHQVPSGFYSAHSWLVVPGTSQVSCVVGLQNNGAKSARLRLEHPDKQERRESGSPAWNGWVAFGLLLVATAIALAVLVAMHMRTRGRKSKGQSGHNEESERLMKDAQQPSTLSEARNHYVNIQLEDKKNEFLKVQGTLLRDAAGVMFPDGNKVTCLTAIKGMPGFSTGKHYWEVSVSKDSIGDKLSWWIGVTNAVEILQEDNFPPNTSNGFWLLSSSPDVVDFLQINTVPNIMLPIYQRPKTVGVYLNYEGGQLSFYDVAAEHLIGSLTVRFNGEVFPLFNPGKGDAAPMQVLHRKVEEVRTDSAGQEHDQ